MVRFTFNPHLKIENPIVIGENERLYFLENEIENEDMLRKGQLSKSELGKVTKWKGEDIGIWIRDG